MRFFSLIFIVFAENSNGVDVESDSELQQLFTPFRGYCARKGVLHLISIQFSKCLPITCLLSVVCRDDENNSN